MKKRLIALLMCVAACVSLTACGNNNGNAEGTEVTEGTEVAEDTGVPMPYTDLAKYEFHYSDYVTLPDYSAIPVELSKDYTVTEQDAVDYIKDWFEENKPFYVTDETKTVVGANDVVLVDYVGKHLDGTVFEGGSATDQTIDVAGNCVPNSYGFIPGFTDCLVGAEVGTEVSGNVMFPEDYGTEELNGKEVIFTFTVHEVRKPVTEYEAIDDAFVQKFTGEENLEALHEMIYESMVEENAYLEKEETTAAIQSYLLANSVVEIPADYFADVLKAFRDTFVWVNCENDESKLEEFLSANYGFTVEQAEEEWKVFLQEELKMEFISEAIAEEMGITLNQEVYDADLASVMSYYGMEDSSEIYESSGWGDAAYGEKRMKNVYIQEDVFAALTETAVFSIAEPSAE